MAESSPLQSIDDERELLKATLEHPFEPTDEVPYSTSPSTTVMAPSPTPPALVSPALVPPPEPRPVEVPPTEDDTWQAAYAAQLSEWRAQSASARTKAELARAKWEAIRARESTERQALGQPPEPSDELGAHITESTTSASEIVSRSLSVSVASLSSAEHVELHGQPGVNAEQVQHDKTEDSSPSQPWEHISSSPISSYPSMSFPGASVPQSPSPQPAFLVPTSTPGPIQTHPHAIADQTPTNVLPSTLPSIMDNRVATRTRLSLTLSSLAINLLLPFINGVMLGFGEIFAKDVVIGWFGWKRRGSTATRLGLRR